jgi:transposase InsO family protein
MSGFSSGKTGVPCRAYRIFSRIQGYRRYKDMLYSLRKFKESEIAQEKMKIINFYDQYGEEKTKEFFGADRKVVSRWKKRLKEERGRLTSLIPHSTRPRVLRSPTVSPLIVEFIKSMREAHYRLGKEKLKIFVDKYCRENSLKTISTSTIGNTIKRHHFFFQKAGKVYHDPASIWAQKKALKKKRLRVKHAPKPRDYGHIASDTVERIVDGIKHYYYNAIDIKMKFALSLYYKTLDSQNMKDFYDKFKGVYPGEIKDWQTDNGKENLKDFDKELERERIPHLFIYPNCPQINTVIERYNRSMQEEFVDVYEDLIYQPKLFSQKLAEYNVFYDTQRPHHSLGLKSPLQYLADNGQMSQMSLTYTNT